MGSNPTWGAITLHVRQYMLMQVYCYPHLGVAQGCGHDLNVDSCFQSNSRKGVAMPVERQVRQVVPLDDTG